MCDGSHCHYAFQIILFLSFILVLRDPNHLLVLFQPPNSNTCQPFTQFHHLSPPPLITQPHSRHHLPVSSFTSLTSPHPTARTPRPAPPPPTTTPPVVTLLPSPPGNNNPCQPFIIHRLVKTQPNLTAHFTMAIGSIP